MKEKLEQRTKKEPLFDGGGNSVRWMAHGIPEGVVPNQYLKKCDMGAVNLHIYRIGRYEGCSGCKNKKACQDYGNIAGQQAEI